MSIFYTQPAALILSEKLNVRVCGQLGEEYYRPWN